MRRLSADTYWAHIWYRRQCKYVLYRRLRLVNSRRSDEGWWRHIIPCLEEDLVLYEHLEPQEAVSDQRP